MIRRRVVVLYPAFLFCAWILAWVVGVALRDVTSWGVTADTAYWIAMKVAIWIGPVFWFLRSENQSVWAYLGLTEPKRGIGIGVMIGAGVLLFSLLLDLFFGGASVVIPVLDAALFNAILVAPVAEEVALRGFFMRAVVESGKPTSTANWLAAALFVAMHLPGWYFQARLRSPLSILQPGLFLFLLALFLGWLKDRTESLWVPIVVHAMNNAYAAFRG